VKNKGRDIAILRHMGAGQGAILRVFFPACATVGAFGTAAGLLIGVLFCWNIAAIQKFVELDQPASRCSNAQVYFLSRVPAKIEWHEVWAITLIRAGRLVPGHPAAGLARLAPRSGRGAPLMSDHGPGDPGTGAQLRHRRPHPAGAEGRRRRGFPGELVGLIGPSGSGKSRCCTPPAC